jgi:hypothetical protein
LGQIYVVCHNLFLQFMKINSQRTALSKTESAPVLRAPTSLTVTGLTQRTQSSAASADVPCRAFSAKRRPSVSAAMILLAAELARHGASFVAANTLNRTWSAAAALAWRGARHMLIGREFREERVRSGRAAKT